MPQPSDFETVSNLDEISTYLTDTYWNEVGFQRFHFADGDITVNIANLTAEGQQLARWAFDAWEQVADLDFTYVTGAAEIEIDDARPGASGGPNAVNLSTGVNANSTVNISTSWIESYGTGIDSYSFAIYMHEIGHALGLGHMGHYDGNAVFGEDAHFENDSWQVSVMSYFDQADNTNTDATKAALLTPMMAGIAAMQDLYGTPGADSATAGNTVWGAGSTLDTYLGAFFDSLTGPAPAGLLSEGGNVALTIYDQGGIDMLDLSYSDAGDRVSLVDNTFSDVDGLIGNLAIARGTVIENVKTGAGADYVLGNWADNMMVLGDGNDVAAGGGGVDRIFGGGGNDDLRGGAGDDVIGGASGDDTLSGNDGDDKLFGAAGHDKIWGGAGNDTLGGFTGDDTISGEDGDDEVWGSVGNDSLMGGLGNDTLGGFTGDDTLDGGGGADELWGHDGRDLLEGGGGADALGAGAGDDTLDGGAGNDEVSGGTGSDIIRGGAGNDTIYGASGDDTIEGGAGNDLLYGGAGADSFVFGTQDGDDDVVGFRLGQGDTLRLDDALWSGTLTGGQIVNQFATLDGSGNAVLDFGSTRIELTGMTTLTGLADAIETF